MRSLSQFLFAMAVGVTSLLQPINAGAQGAWEGRVQEALDVTDRRIERAEVLIPDGVPAPAAGELAIARQIQARARSAFGAAQYGIAERTTLEARNHADRAIAIVSGLPDPDRVQSQVDRTAELAERARERLAECADARAKALLRVGLEMQIRAEVAVRESRHLAALQLTMSARERLLKAMRLCNVAESLGESAARALRRTDDVIARAREGLEEGGSPEAKRSLERAVSLQMEAQAEFRALHFESVLRLTHTARLVAQRAIRAVPSSGAGSGRRGRR